MGKFRNLDDRNKHQADCCGLGTQAVKFPKTDEVNLRKANYCMDSMYFLVADFECVIQKYEGLDAIDGITSFTAKEGIHQVCSYAWA